MNTTQISLDTFKNILKKEVEGLCREEGLNHDKEADRGYVFQKWCANLLIKRDGLNVDDLMMFASNDFKIDVVLEDLDARRSYLIRTKYPSPSSSPPVLEDEVITFFDRHGVFEKEPSYVRTHASDTLLEYIADYGSRLEDGWLLYWYFMTTGKASDRLNDLCIAKDSAAKLDYANVGLRLFDVSGLEELYIQSQTLEQSIPEQTKFQLRKQSWLIKSDHYRTLVAIVKGTTLAGLYKKERERIFAYNIRSYLGKIS